MLRTKVFGIPEFSIDGQSLTQTLTGRRLALLAYLLCQEQPSPRSVLCDLLWTDLPEEQAREYLRGLLSHTRRVMGDYIVADRQAVAFNRAAPYWADVEAFSTFFAAGPASADPALLSQTLDLYRGEFLAGVYIQEAPVFEGWLLAQRQQWQTQAVHGWQQLAHYHFTQGDDTAGLVANARLLALEPWHEEAHRRQMVMLARSGQRDAALAYFDRCCAILREEVDAPPDAETIAVYEQIKAGVWSPNGTYTHPQVTPIPVAAGAPAYLHPQAPTQPKATNGHPGAVPTATALARMTSAPIIPTAVTPDAPALAIDWGSMPHEPRFYGRQAELRQLHQWCIHERRRVVTVLGVGGQGKTALAVRFVRTLTEAPQAGNGAEGEKPAPVFERVIWRSLLAAPPLTDILQDWLQPLSDQQVVTRPPTLDQQFTLLHDYLQRRRFLLVLDNIESILLDDGSGACRPGYEAYEQLWQLFAQRDHQCCLLLTSRERPRVFSSHEEQTGALRTLLLDGLTLADGQQLLRTHRVVGEEATMRALLGCYSGNPLALKLVADTIDELFAGNVAAFLREETPFFADIAAVLDHQFARLSPLESELLTWLALEQEPITSQTLWENLVAPPAKRDFLSALRTLVRRSLVQTQGELFSLQNVILEYTRSRLVNEIGEELSSDRFTRSQADRIVPEQPLLAFASHPILSSSFNRYALLKAHAPEYIRNGQRRLVLAPLARRLAEVWGATKVTLFLQQLLRALHATNQQQPSAAAGYAAANLFHLLLDLEQPLAAYDFSHLTLRQASLRAAPLTALPLAGAHLDRCDFTDAFLSITTLVFHPAGDQFIGGAINGELYSWRLSTPESRPQASHRLSGHGQSIFGMAISPDGALVASSGLDQRTFVWELPTYRLRYAITETKNYARSIAFSPNGAWLAVISGDSHIKLYAAHSGELCCTLVSPSQWLWTIAFRPDSAVIAAGGVEGAIYLWFTPTIADAQPDTPTAPYRSLPGHRSSVESLVFSRDGRSLFSGGHDHLIYQWDVTTANDQPQRTLRGHSQYVRTLALSPDGQLLASGSADQTVRLWNVQTGELLDTLVGHEQLVWAVAFHPRPAPGTQILLSTAGDQHILLWEIANQATYVHGRLRTRLQGYIDAVRAALFHPNGKTLITGGFDKRLHCWDLESGRFLSILRAHADWVFTVAISPDGQWVASGDYAGQIQLGPFAPAPLRDQPSPRSTPTQTRLLQEHTQPILGLAFRPDSNVWASCSHDQTIRLWDRQGQTLEILTGHAGSICEVAFSPDGCWLVSGGLDQTVRLWDVRNLPAAQVTLTPAGDPPDGHPRLVRTFRGHTHTVWCVSFSPDGQSVVSCSGDQTVRIWSTTGDECRILTGHSGLVRWVAVSPQPVQGRLTLASCAQDGVIRIWDWASGETIHELRGHSSFIHTLTYNAAGTLLVSAGDQGEIRLWDVQSGACRQTLWIPKPYTGMNITGVTGITPAQKAALLALGAVEQ